MPATTTLVLDPDRASATASTPPPRVPRGATRRARAANPLDTAPRRAVCGASATTTSRSSCDYDRGRLRRRPRRWVAPDRQGPRRRRAALRRRPGGGDPRRSPASGSTATTPSARCSPRCGPGRPTSATLTIGPTTAGDRRGGGRRRRPRRRAGCSRARCRSSAAPARSPCARRAGRTDAAHPDRRLAARAARRRADAARRARRPRSQRSRPHRRTRASRSTGPSVSVVPAVDRVSVGVEPRRRPDRARQPSRRRDHRTTAPPAHTTEWAQKLNITELVSSFTTELPLLSAARHEHPPRRRRDQRHDRRAGRDVLASTARSARAPPTRATCSRPGSAPTSSSRTRWAAG